MSDYSCVLCASVSKQTSAEPIEFIYCAECGMTTTHRIDVVPGPTLEERLERLEGALDVLQRLVAKLDTKPLLVLGLFLVGCSGPEGSVVSEVTADEFKRIDVGDEWDG